MDKATVMIEDGREDGFSEGAHVIAKASGMILAIEEIYVDNGFPSVPNVHSRVKAVLKEDGGQERADLITKIEMDALLEHYRVDNAPLQMELARNHGSITEAALIKTDPNSLGPSTIKVVKVWRVGHNHEFCADNETGTLALDCVDLSDEGLSNTPYTYETTLEDLRT